MLKQYKNTLITLLAYLTITMSAVSVYAETNLEYRQEPITPIPQPVIVDQAKVRLGELLFFDTRLSKNNAISCATCHQLKMGGDDNVAMGISSSTEKHVINTPTVFNAVFNFRQNWNGSANTLAEQIDMVMFDHHEFSNQWSNVTKQLSLDKDLSNIFNTIYKDGLTKENITDAIVEYEKTLVTPDSRFDNYLKNEDETLTDKELSGYKLFKEYGCISCHQGVNIGGNLFQKFGIFYDYIAERGRITKQDYGKFNITNRQLDKFVFKVPSLRNIAVTAPYLHDGSAETLEEVISIMGKTQLGRTLSEKDIALIKSFLNTLTGKYNNKSLDDAS